MPIIKTTGKPNNKGRPIKVRTVRNDPKTKQFSPRGRVGRPGYKALKIEEIEAIRMADYIGLNQRESAKFMGVSQQTFSRVLRNARKCLAEALINGDIIKIQGGHFKVERSV